MFAYVMTVIVTVTVHVIVAEVWQEGSTLTQTRQPQWW